MSRDKNTRPEIDASLEDANQNLCDVTTLNRRARALNSDKQHIGAIKLLEQALEVDPSNEETHIILDEAYADVSQWILAARYRSFFGKFPRLHPPLSFNEHILHRIIFDRDPLLKCFCDKLATKRFVEESIGRQYAVPLIGAWRNPREVIWDRLPNKFVLKPNHSCNDYRIVDRTIGCDYAGLVELALQWLSRDFFDQSLEWGYRGLPRVLLAEPFLCSRDGEKAPELQVYTFHGKAKLLTVLVGIKKTAQRTECWFDRKGRQLNIRKATPIEEFPLKKEDRKLAIRLAERLAKSISSLRVDFYITANGLLVGELSPYTNGAMASWRPGGLDDLLGKLWDVCYDDSRLFEDIEKLTGEQRRDGVKS